VEALDSQLMRRLGTGLARIAADREHSLEIELPFLQRAVVPGWRLLPVMVNARDPVISEGVGAALADVLRGTDFVLVGSTDLSHYRGQPEALRLDRAMLRQIERLSPGGMFELERAGEGSACGLGAVAAMLWAAMGLGADHAVTLCHATSADVTGDFESVVGYGATAILRSGAS
jgi:AmmeMemoRadiSam system protein B